MLLCRFISNEKFTINVDIHGYDAKAVELYLTNFKGKNTAKNTINVSYCVEVMLGLNSSKTMMFCISMTPFSRTWN